MPAIIGALPYTLVNGTIADATQVMGDLNYIVSQVNANAGAAGSGLAKNVLYNGAMRVAQRGAAAIHIGSGGTALFVDRWEGHVGALAAADVSQISSTTLNQFQYAARVQRTAGNTSLGAIQLAQSLESVDSIPLQGQTVTLSFWARNGATYSPAGSLLAGTVYTGTGTDENVFGYTGSAASIPGSFTLTAAWQRFQVTGVIPTTATEIGVIFTADPTGTAGANDYFDITGVQLEIAAAAGQFDFIPFGDDLDRCSRYYQSSFPYGTVPAQGAGITGAVEYAVLVAAATQTANIIPFNRRMRISPTITTYNPVSANAKWYNNTAAADSGSPTAAVGAWGFSLTNPQVGGDSVGNLCYIHWSAECEL